MFSGFSHCGIAAVVTPMIATLTPPTVLTRYGASGGTAPTVFADSQGKRAVSRAAARFARPKLSSWLPTTIAS